MYYAFIKNESGNITRVVKCSTQSVGRRASEWHFSDADELFMLRDVSLTALAEVYNSFAEKPVAKFADRPSAARRVFALLEEKVGELPSFHEARSEKKPATKKPVRSMKREYAYSVDGKNPMRPTSRSGQTIQAIIDNPGINISQLLEDNPTFRIQAIYGAVRMGAVEIVGEEEHQRRQAGNA